MSISVLTLGALFLLPFATNSCSQTGASALLAAIRHFGLSGFFGAVCSVDQYSRGGTYPARCVRPVLSSGFPVILLPFLFLFAALRSCTESSVPDRRRQEPASPSLRPCVSINPPPCPMDRPVAEPQTGTDKPKENNNDHQHRINRSQIGQSGDDGADGQCEAELFRDHW